MHRFDSLQLDEHTESNKQEKDHFSFVFDTVDQNPAEDMLHHISNFNSAIIGSNLNQSTTDKIFKATINLIKQTHNFYISTLNEDHSESSPAQILEQCSDFVCSKISQNKSTYLRKKQFKASESYVAPKECAIGLRWEMKKCKRFGKVRKIPRLVQCTFQFVSIVETISSLFKSEEFKKMYFEYNMSQKHDCNNNIYYDFCCGDKYKKNEFFKRNPLALQIQMYLDDFEICNPLASVSTKRAVFIFPS